MHRLLFAPIEKQIKSADYDDGLDDVDSVLLGACGGVCELQTLEGYSRF